MAGILSATSDCRRYRDLFNTFRNDWIIKIELNGLELRKLLTVPFADISKRDVDAPMIEGVTFVRTGQGLDEKILSITELENDKIYTVALSEKCLNGRRTGVVLKDYEITGDDYLVPLLEDYLHKNINLNIDAKLDSFKLEIF